MEFSRSQLPGQTTTATAAQSEPAFVILTRQILYRGLVLMLVLAGAGFFCAASAQEERPQITPGERKVPRKKESGPRALAVLQMTAKSKVSVVPVAILVNGKFYDATAYKADPVPMALDSGTIYEGERTGNSLGLFTVGSALHSNAVNAPNPWIGTGDWRPTGTEVASKGNKAEATPVGIDKSDEPPRLSKNPNAPKETAPANSAPAATPTSTPTPTQPSGDEPPRLSKTTPAGTAPEADSKPADTKASDPKPADAKPSDSKPADAKTTADTKTGDAKTDAKTDDRPKAPTSDSGASEANRPRLRRGVPATPFAEEEVPGYSKFGSAKKPKPGAIVEAAAASGPVQIVPAISDATGPEPRSYTFEWLKGEEDDRRKQMMDLAKQQLRAYLDAQAKAKTTAKPAAKGTKAPARKPLEPIFGNVQLVAYDLWTNNQPVLVFSADAHMPAAPAGVGQSAYDAELQYSITLVAYPDTYNNLRKIYSGITDKYHLDITPRLELIDAIDADGDGRGELLFRATSDNGTGWILYRASQDKLWKLFDSLNPE